MAIPTHPRRTASRLAAAILLASPGLQGQSVSLSLADAIRLAEGKSENVAVAQAGLRQARGEQTRARAQGLPQLIGSASYTRTLASQFRSVFASESVPQCDPLSINPSAPVANRVAEIERFLDCGGGLSFDFGGDGGLPFGRTNIWNLGLSFNQSLYSGGRISAQKEAAEAGRESAEIEVDSTQAQFLLDVSQGFYNAALADSLLEVAQATLDQAQKTLEVAQLNHEVGNTPEFDVLRAQVAHDNQLPVVTRRAADRREAYLRLYQLLELPLDTPVDLEANLGSEELPAPAPFDAALREASVLETAEERAPVRQADEAIRQVEAQLSAASAQRQPAIGLFSQYGLVAYPGTFFPTSTNQFRNNWTLGASLQIPLLTFGRIRADEEVAAANVDRAQAQRQQALELALLDASSSLNQLRAAEEQWRATAGTVTQAGRAYEIAGLRYREGISNQLELTDALVLLAQARTNRAQAARDLQVARVRLALLPRLPLNQPQPTPAAVAQRPQKPTAAQTATPFATSPASSTGNGLGMGQTGLGDLGIPRQ